MRAVALQGQFPMQIRVIGITERADRGETIQGAAQNHDNQPRIPGASGARPSRQIRGGEDRPAQSEELAPAGMAGEDHAYLLWNSGERIIRA
jgi:hypothetical protein